MHDYTQTVRRAAVGVSALGWIALMCLIGSIGWWLSLFINLLSPPGVLSPQMIQALLMTVAFGLVLPLFWSMLLPSSPAGRLLQKQQWATPGYVAVIVAATFLTYNAWRWSLAWWQAQPGVVEVGQALMLSITTLIAAVLLPALAWCVVTPEQWIAQIEQARQVKRIEMAMKMEEAAMRASYARAVALLNAGISTLAIEQRKELAGILGGFARAQQQALTAIGQSWKDMYGVEAIMGGTPDKQLIAQYSQVVNLLAEGNEAMDDVAYVAQAPALAPPAPSGRPLVDRADDAAYEPIARSTTRHQDTTDRAQRSTTGRPGAPAHRPSSGPVAARPAGDRAMGERPSHAAYLAAYSALRGAWTRADLEEALSISKTQALTYIQAWLTSGDIIKLDEPRNHYEFTGVN
jgi:hypothetical protein